MPDNKIRVRGARVHNLKNVDIDLPRNKLVVFTGLSGSGKSSLAFDTIYAEGQRRYVESLSAYARQFLGLMDKPDVDQIDGLSPAISIDQRSASRNPRSTVGTITEIYDYLRLLFARVGHPHCPQCGREVAAQTATQITDGILDLPEGTKIHILSPVIKDRKGEHHHLFEELKKAGYQRVRIDGTLMELEEALGLTLDKQKKHSVDVIIDRLTIERGEDADRARIADSVETALDLGDGIITIHNVETGEDKMVSEHFVCLFCDLSLPDIQPRSFSFNSPHGACPTCTGLGTKLEVDADLIIPNMSLTLAEGAIRPWARTTGRSTWYGRMLYALASKYGFSMSTAVSKLSKDVMQVLLYGTGDEQVEIEDPETGEAYETTFEGVIPNLERRYRETDSDYIRRETEKYMNISLCPTCTGKRLRKEVLSVTVNDLSIDKVVAMNIALSMSWFSSLESTLSAKEKKIAKQIIKEILTRLQFLVDVGLTYLTLDRAAATLSGGEAQRIRLATQIGSALTGVLYILDEPSIGLHQRDNSKLITTLKNLRDLGNTVIVVEHDEETMLAADFLVDIGPGAGAKGGEIVAAGTPEQVMKSGSLTGQYLEGKLRIEMPTAYRSGTGKSISIIGAKGYNLKNIDVSIPLGMFVAVTGVSGSGKSTLINEILAKSLSKHFYRSTEPAAEHKEIRGLDHLDSVIDIDQSPIGRTPRSNAATYTGIFTLIRDLFVQTPEAKIRGYNAGRFSFNVKGGRCEACHGEGYVRIEMQFLPDVFVECEECKGARYNKQALEIHFKGKNIADVLNMSVEEAFVFFQNIPALRQKLQTMLDVGIGYVKLGQPATTLSGGEAQRIKLATELGKRSTGKTLYILDEPTTGLHFDDVMRLMLVLNKLVDKGNTVLVIEHNLDVIKGADHIIDLGPDGGDAGGTIVAQGTPLEVSRVKGSYTGLYLAKEFEKWAKRGVKAPSRKTPARQLSLETSIPKKSKQKESAKSSRR